MSIVSQIRRAWSAIQATQEIARNSADAEIEQYARVKPNPHSPALFDDQGNARWITIGSEKGEDGKSHGGHHVKIDNEGKMLTGQFAGQTLKQAFGDHGKLGSQKPSKKATVNNLGYLRAKNAGLDDDSLLANSQGHAVSFVGHDGKTATYHNWHTGEKEHHEDPSEAKPFEAWDKDLRSGVKPQPRHEDEKAQLVADLENAEGMGGWAHAKKIRAELDSKYPGWDDENMGGSDPIGRSLGAKIEDGARQKAMEAPNNEARQSAIQKGLASVKRVPHLKTAAQAAMNALDPYHRLSPEERAQFGSYTEYADAIGKAFQESMQAPQGPGAPVSQQALRDLAPKQEAYDPRAALKAANDEMERLAEKSDPLFKQQMALMKELRQVSDSKIGQTNEIEWKRLNREQNAINRKLEKVSAELTPINRRIGELKDEGQKHIAEIRKQEAQAKPASSPSPMQSFGSSVADAMKRQAEAQAKPQAFQPVLDETNQPKPGIVAPSNTIGNEQAKAGDQLGLFGDAVKAPSKKPTMAGDPKAKAVGLFDTRGEADQMDLFGDGVMPEDLVFKPKAFEPVLDDSAKKKEPDAPVVEESKGEEKPSEKPVEAPAEEVKPEAKPSNEIRTLADYKAYMNRLDDGKVTAEEHREAFKQFQANRENIKAELSKLKKDEISSWHHEDGIAIFSPYADRDTKARNIEHTMNRFDDSFDKTEGARWYSHGEDLKAKRENAIASMTDDHIKKHAEGIAKERAEREAKRKARQESIDNPKTAEDWMNARRRAGGYHKLTAEQQAAHDEAYAQHRREKSPFKPPRPTEVKAFEGGAEKTGEVGIVQGHHQKRNAPTWTVTVQEHLGDSWKDVLSKAKNLGGNYVNARIAKAYKATPGFQFFDEESAKKFHGVMTGQKADLSDKMADREEEKRIAQGARLAELASSRMERAEESLGRERKDNTYRRASMAASAEAEARKELAAAKTMDSLAKHIEDGKAVHLQHVKNKAQVDQLDRALRQAHWNHYRHLQKNDQEFQAKSYSAREDFMNGPPTKESIAHAEYPYPYMHKSEMLSMGAKLSQVPGLKLFGGKLKKMAEEIGKEDGNDYGQIRNAADLEKLKEAIPKMRRHGSAEVRSIASRFSEKFESMKRLEGMDITNTPELRAALREYHSIKENPAVRIQSRKPSEN